MGENKTQENKNIFSQNMGKKTDLCVKIKEWEKSLFKWKELFLVVLEK